MIAKRECERKDSRTYKIYVNLSIALSMQLFQVLLGFAVRKVFILTLGVAYLGYNSVFSNILQMLSLADLGIGVAVTSYLYKPLADNECDRVNALMALYKKIYNIIGIIVLIIGIIISFILEYIIPDISISTGYLRCLFFIHLGGTVSSYYLAYKRTLIIADQKSYVANLVDGISYLVISGVQILILLIKPNYMIFLVLNVAKNIISNVIISLFCNRKYGKIEKNVDNKLISEYKPQVVQYIKDVFISRIGAVVYYGTDSIIISIYRGSLLAGYLSNYTLITGYLNIIISQLLSSVQATFGNYINSGNSVYQQRKMTDHYFLANYFMGNFCMICFIFLVQPFVSLYFGQKLLLPFSTAVWLGVNFLLTTLIQLPSQVFTIYKLFRYDRPIIIVSTLLNVFISVLLVKKLGVDGVLIGTFITSLIYLFSRFYAIAKYVFKVNYLYYLKKVFQYFAVSAASFFITYTVFRNGQKVVGFSFIIRAICVSLLAILTPATALSKTEEFKFLTDKLIPKKISGYIRSRTLAAATILVIAASLIIGGGVQSDEIDITNKSLHRDQVYYQEKPLSETKIFHFSVDDTIECFKDINTNNYNTIFQNPTFAWFKDLHEKFGVVISCYVYYQDGEFALSDCTDRYRNEFASNEEWLRFGFHTLDKKTVYDKTDIYADYVKTMKELIRIVGSGSIDHVIRLQGFQGNSENIEDLVDSEIEPIVGLLTSDDGRDNYYLSEEQNNYIYCHDILYDDTLDINLISTDIRIEYLDSTDYKFKEFETAAWNNQLDILEIFSHEWILNVDEMNKVEEFCRFAAEHEYRSVFYEEMFL